MSKKTAILILVGLILAIAAISVIFYLRSLHSVTLTIKNNLHVSIYKSSDTHANARIAYVTKSGVIQLQSGDYVAIPDGGTNYDTSPIGFTVTDTNIKISINPGYSTDYLNTLLTGQLEDINNTISSAYPTVIGDFSIDTGNLYEEGQWYATTLSQIPTNSDQGDIYRVVLEKINGKWEVKTTPAIVLSASDNKDIPTAILKDINSRQPPAVS